MSSPSNKKRKECHGGDSEGRAMDPRMENTEGSSSISLLISGDLAVGVSVTSTVHRIDGFPWRVSVKRKDDIRSARRFEVSLLCDASIECELWRCEVTSTITTRPAQSLLSPAPKSDSFGSWKRNRAGGMIMARNASPTILEVGVSTDANGESFTRRPSIEECSSVYDVVLVVEGQKIPANKRVLAAHSGYFRALFFGGFKERKQDEIEIKNAKPEDFRQLLKIFYGDSTKPNTEKDAEKYLMMADMYDLKIVMDRIENFLLSSTHLSSHRKLILANQFRLNMLKSEMISVKNNRRSLPGYPRS